MEGAVLEGSARVGDARHGTGDGVYQSGDDAGLCRQVRQCSGQLRKGLSGAGDTLVDVRVDVHSLQTVTQYLKPH